VRRGSEGRGKMDEKRTNKIRTVRDLKVYRKAFDSAMEIFELTKKFPKVDRFRTGGGRNPNMVGIFLTL